MRSFKLTSILFALVLFVSQNLWAQTEAQSFRKQVGEVVYSLENLKHIAADIDKMDYIAADALSVELAAEVTERMLTALELMKLIYRDPYMSQEEKIKYHEDLGVKLADLLMIIIRQHGDDQLDPEMDKRHPVLQYGAKAAVEVGRTFTDLLTFPRVAKDDSVPGADGHRVAKMRDRMIREYISQQAIIGFQDLMKDYAGINLTDPQTVKAYKGMRFALMVPEDKKEANPKEWGPKENDLGTAEKALRVRQNRVSAHISALATIAVGYVGIALLMPVDFVGMSLGFNYDPATARISDFLAFSGAVSIALIRQATGSFKAIAPLKTLMQIIKDPNSAELSKVKVPLMARMMRVKSKIERARETLRQRSGNVGSPFISGGRCELLFNRSL